MNMMPTEDEIRKLTVDSPLLYAAIKMGDVHHLLWEDIMMYVVKLLVEDNNKIKKEYRQLLEISTNPSFSIPHKS